MKKKQGRKKGSFHVRDEFGGWDPKRQRPELWNIYNADPERRKCKGFPHQQLDIVNIPKLGPLPFGVPAAKLIPYGKILSFALAFSSSRRPPPIRASKPNSHSIQQGKKSAGHSGWRTCR